ncbi:hypothetical protein [Streptomyces cyaneofuscatus]|uniref:hypothetical protein n=1 Tax=Streptomyces cyaneofuscatus TaxID=66883 RepID=UPI00380222C0
MLTLAETLLAALPAHGLAGLIDDDGVIVHPVTTTAADALRGVHVLIGAFAPMSAPAPARTILGARAYAHDGGTDYRDLGELYYAPAALPLTQAVSEACTAAAEWFAPDLSDGTPAAPVGG